MRIYILTLILLCPLVLFAQRGDLHNEGTLYVSPETLLTAEANFNNKATGEYTNDGEVLLRGHFNNDGLTGFTEDLDGYTRFQGFQIQEISGIIDADFNTVEDNYNAFNNSSGVFTAPREGYYYVSLNYTLSSGEVNNNSYIESIIVSSNSQNNIKEYRGLNSFPGFHTNYTPQIEVAGNATALFYLKEGDTVHFRIYHTLGRSKTNTGNADENRISIIEI
ncbi:MAG TPA: hypothetical protein VFD91_09745 [Mariniphaga sp.]|nr:hypothetical protein [Mariniphaga sp.]